MMQVEMYARVNGYLHGAVDKILIFTYFKFGKCSWVVAMQK
jgi:hypothetical protein